MLIRKSENHGSYAVVAKQATVFL